MKNFYSRSIIPILLLGLIGCAPSTSKSYLRLPYEGRPEYAPPKNMTLKQKAEMFQDMLEKYHIAPSGLMIYRRDIRKHDSIGFSYNNLSDSPIWNGCHLAAESFRYAVTKSPEALEAVRRSVKGIHLLQAVHGVPGLLARHVIPKDDKGFWEEGPGQLSEGVGDYSNFMWRHEVSKDQYSGIVFGYGVATMLVDDPEVRAQVRKDITAIADYLMENDYIIIDADGEPTKYSNMRAYIGPVPIGVHAFISLCAIHTAWKASGEEKYRLEYERLKQKNWHKATWLVKFKVLGQTNHNNDNMGMIASYPLLMQEKDPKVLKYYERSINRTWRYVRHEGNALYTSIYLGTGGKDPQAQEDSLLQLRNFPISKRHYGVNNLGREDIKVSMFKNRKGARRAIYPLPINFRPQTGWAWRDDPYRLKWPGDDQGNTQSAPVDFLLPYWMGRYHGLIGEGD